MKHDQASSAGHAGGARKVSVSRVGIRQRLVDLMYRGQLGPSRESSWQAFSPHR